MFQCEWRRAPVEGNPLPFTPCPLQWDWACWVILTPGFSAFPVSRWPLSNFLVTILQMNLTKLLIYHLNMLWVCSLQTPKSRPLYNVTMYEHFISGSPVALCPSSSMCGWHWSQKRLFQLCKSIPVSTSRLFQDAKSTHSSAHALPGFLKAHTTAASTHEVSCQLLTRLWKFSITHLSHQICSFSLRNELRCRSSRMTPTFRSIRTLSSPAKPTVLLKILMCMCAYVMCVHMCVRACVCVFLNVLECTQVCNCDCTWRGYRMILGILPDWLPLSCFRKTLSMKPKLRSSLSQLEWLSRESVNLQVFAHKCWDYWHAHHLTWLLWIWT